jgi:prolyl-tRNA synthetase
MIRWSRLNHKTFKEDPSDAEIPSHKLLMRAGLAKKIGAGLYTYGYIFLKAMRKVEAILREELASIDSHEILMPMVQPKSLWEESGRWGYPDLQTFKNKKDYDFCLGPTHEEVVTDYVRNSITSYKDLPYDVYQIQTKYRDEVRPRFGLMRAKEFVMKDAYSFDKDQASAHESYYRYKNAYSRIFDRIGLEYRVVKADSGAIGGSLTEEFQILADVGEDLLMVSDKGSFAANVEICPRLKVEVDKDSGVLKEEKLEKFETKGLRTIEDLSKFLNVPSHGLVKTMFFQGHKETDEKPFNFTVLLRGSDEVNPIKIKNVLGLKDVPLLLNETEVKEFAGAMPGSCGPVNLKGTGPICLDQNIEDFKSMVVGANIDDFHLRGVQPGRDFKVESVFDLTMAQEGDPSPEGEGVLKSIRGIEAGHIFYLGKKYSKAMKANFLDQNGKAQEFEMGCYGIGVSRIVQAAIEQRHDENGIKWPMSLAPFHLHICLLDDQDEMKAFVEKLASELEDKSVEVFLDDRKERPGVKFKDADLLGFPLRLVVGQKSFSRGVVELVKRDTLEKVEVTIDGAKNSILEALGV